MQKYGQKFPHLQTVPPRRPSIQDLIASVPVSPGVYFFYGADDLLLYVGKSKSLRARVRSHFRDRSERWMMKRVHRVDYLETAGELGALLLELRLIKELRPMYNVASKQKRRIILADRRRTPEGYDAVVLKAVDTIDPGKDTDILGVFKHRTQAREFLGAISKTHALCHKLLGLERARTYCFGYHIGRCRGACAGEEPADAYNERLEAAFTYRRIRSWPFKRGIVLEESSGGRSEMFLIDNWCLMGSLTQQDGMEHQFVPSMHRFDYDTYRILYGFVADPSGRITLREPAKREWERLLQLSQKTG